MGSETSMTGYIIRGGSAANENDVAVSVRLKFRTRCQVKKTNQSCLNTPLPFQPTAV